MLTADQDVERQQCGTFTFVGHEMGEGAIFVELLSGSDAEKFNEYLNAKGSTSEKHQRLDGDIDPPIATAPPLTESEVELRYNPHETKCVWLRDPSRPSAKGFRSTVLV